MEGFWNDFVAQVDVWALVTLAVLILANLVLGLVSALRFGKLELVKLADFIKERIIPYVGGYLVVVVVAAVPMATDTEYAGWFKALPLTAFAFIVASMIGKLKEQLQALGLPLPNLPFEAKATSTTTTPK